MEDFISYNGLWKRLIDMGMNKKELSERAGVSGATLARMKRGKAISYRALRRISAVVGMTMEEMMG